MSEKMFFYNVLVITLLYQCQHKLKQKRIYLTSRHKLFKSKMERFLTWKKNTCNRYKELSQNENMLAHS